ncbi:hypothetical protein [Blastopirellula retiformator]|uniref:Uncharacterized protein n=1 Tax=Blastopirellula retiformator TaxID=2527970 RepID=A0A5C5USW0_9BACT|nr:hypothetical protein [Blastopirellula retiformator]TWT29266.1 hypothetical protein Enr8_50670 [Blastopirellula retiformator]
MYDKSDLEIVTSIEHIRERPEMYLAGGDVSADALANRLLLDLQSMPTALVVYQQFGDWRILGSDRNWVGDVAEPHDVFERIVTYHRNQRTSFHAEVLLAAFARDVVLFSGSEPERIQGNAKIPAELIEFTRRYPQLVRCTVFSSEA